MHLKVIESSINVTILYWIYTILVFIILLFYNLLFSGVVKSYATHTYMVDDVPYRFTIDQTINFKECSGQALDGIGTQKLVISRPFVVYGEAEEIVRYATTNKMSPDVGTHTYLLRVLINRPQKLIINLLLQLQKYFNILHCDWFWQWVYPEMNNKTLWTVDGFTLQHVLQVEILVRNWIWIVIPMLTVYLRVVHTGVNVEKVSMVMDLGTDVKVGARILYNCKRNLLCLIIGLFLKIWMFNVYTYIYYIMFNIIIVYK